MDHIRFYLLPRIKNTTVSVGQTAANESNHEGFFLGSIMFGKKKKNLKLYMEPRQRWTRHRDAAFRDPKEFKWDQCDFVFFLKKLLRAKLDSSCNVFVISAASVNFRNVALLSRYLGLTDWYRFI